MAAFVWAPGAEVAPGLEDVATQLTSAIGTDQTPAGGVQVLAIIVSLLLVGGYADSALRDFGLLIGALALARLATAYSTPRTE